MKDVENTKESRDENKTEVTMNRRNEGYLYRILPLRYFLLMLEERKIFIPQICKWEDPYELFLLKQTIMDKSGRNVDTHDMAQGIYGQCWSTQRDNDAMWRIYSPDLLSVRIKSQVYKIEELCNEWQHSGIAKFDCRNVVYNKQKDIEAWISSINSASFCASTIIDSLFMKRDSFSHEKEYRIIAWQPNDRCNTNHSELLELPFSPEDFIQEVYLDPRLSEQEVSLLKNAIQIKMGEKCRVSQSTLYKLKQHTIII